MIRLELMARDSAVGVAPVKRDSKAGVTLPAIMCSNTTATSRRRHHSLPQRRIVMFCITSDTPTSVPPTASGNDNMIVVAMEMRSSWGPLMTTYFAVLHDRAAVRGLEAKHIRRLTTHQPVSSSRSPDSRTSAGFRRDRQTQSCTVQPRLDARDRVGTILRQVMCRIPPTITVC